MRSTGPDSKCCRPCTDRDPPGCSPSSDDANCQLGSLPPLDDHLNVRCWDQKRRFRATTFLYPTRRYVDGLSKLTLQEHGEALTNPLLATRNKELVTLMAIVGVPWQDLATPETLSLTGYLEYVAPSVLVDRWSYLVPDCAVQGSDGVCDEWDLNDTPDDEFMVESIAPRVGSNPFTGEETSAPGTHNEINGSEYDIPDHNALQYVCTYPLEDSRDCNTVPVGSACECGSSSTVVNSPACGGPIQYYAVAYPGIRQLEVVKGLGARGLPASDLFPNPSQPPISATPIGPPSTLSSNACRRFSLPLLERSPRHGGDGHSRSEPTVMG